MNRCEEFEKWFATEHPGLVGLNTSMETRTWAAWEACAELVTPIIQHESDCVEAAKARIAELEARADALAASSESMLIAYYELEIALLCVQASDLTKALAAYRASKKGGAA